MPYLDKTQMPTIFGVSGYSGAGTKSGEKDAEGRPKTVAKIVSIGLSDLIIISFRSARHSLPEPILI
jgi:N-acetyl-gamma-glutamyl-phosphate reductase/acetylglutamate kinase